MSGEKKTGKPVPPMLGLFFVPVGGIWYTASHRRVLFLQVEDVNGEPYYCFAVEEWVPEDEGRPSPWACVNSFDAKRVYRKLTADQVHSRLQGRVEGYLDQVIVTRKTIRRIITEKGFVNRLRTD